MTKLQGKLFDDLPAYVGPVTKHPLYRVRASMISRCHYPGNPAFRVYGGRGISVCKEWRQSSRAFISWAINAGWQRGLQIDRKDNDGPYSPGNCRFVTRLVNMNNCSRTLRLSDGTALMDAVRQNGVPASCVYLRLRRGFSADEAVTRPVGTIPRPSVYYLSDGTPLMDAVRSAGLCKNTVHARVRRGWSADEAVSVPPGGKRASVAPSLPALAQSSGLPYATVKSRVRKGWSVRDALAVPPHGKRPAATGAIAQGESVAATLGDEGQRPAIPRGLDLPSADLTGPSYDPGYPAAFCERNEND